MVKVANKYAKALFDVSLDTNNLETINEELTVINEAVKDKIEQLKMVDINPYIKNMMYVLADNRHISLIADVFKAFQSLYNGHYNQDFATIESTYELSQEELDKIVKLVTQQTKLSKVIVDTKINPDLIGGFRVKVGTTVLDGSVRNDLVQLQRKFRRVN